MDDLEALYACMCLMQGNYPISQVNAIYVFGRALRDFERGEQDSGILELGAELYAQGLTPLIGINEGYSGQKAAPTSYPGKTAWTEELVRLEIPRDAIFSIAPANNTKEESNNLVLYVNQMTWKTLIVISNPHQGLRMMLTLVTSLKEHGCQDIRVLPVFPCSVSWTKQVHGSQGQLLLPRNKHVFEEWRRITLYQQKGDLCSFADLYEYLVRATG